MSLYLVDSISASYEATPTLELELPPHQAGDFITISSAQTTGATDQTITTGWTPRGDTTQVINYRMRFWDKFASGSDSIVTLTGGDQNWAVTINVFRGVNPTTPYNISPTRVTTGNAGFIQSGSGTTTVNNCLVMHLIGWRSAVAMIPEVPEDAHLLSRNNDVLLSLSAYYVQKTAGTTRDIKWLADIANTSGHMFRFALNPADPTAPAMPDYPKKYKVISHLSGAPGQANAASAFSRHESITWDNLSNIAATTIDGVAVLSTTPSAYQVNAIAESPYGSGIALQFTDSAIDAAGRLLGNGFQVPASVRNMSGQIFSVLAGFNATASSVFGSKGVIVYFQDVSGNWEAFRAFPRTGHSNSNAHYVLFVALGKQPPIDSSGTMNWSDVRRIAFMFHKVGTSTTTRTLRLKSAFLFEQPQVVGGNPDYPVNARSFDLALNGYGGTGYISAQGSGQAVTRVPLTFGDGTTPTFYRGSGTSTELPLPPDGSFARRFWRVPEDTVKIKFKIGADDSFRIVAGGIVANNRQTLDFTEADNSADISVATPVIGWDVAGGSVMFDGTRLERNHSIVLEGGGLEGARVLEPLGDVAVKTDSPGKISNTRFESKGTGHAIEFTSSTPAGSYDFFDNSFTGYGADGTDDAAILNSSGEEITLVLKAGQQVPTVKNVGGSTTLFDVPAVGIGVSGYETGTRIQLYNVTQDAEIYNDIPSGTSFTYVVSSGEAAEGDVIRLRATKLGKSRFNANNVFAVATGTSFLVEQTEAVIYNSYGIDGETVDEFGWDGLDFDIDLDTLGTTWSAKRLYAWYSWFITTEEGIRDVYGLIIPIDEGNLRLDNIFIDNLGTDSVSPADNIRVFRADGLYPQRTPSTGGGGIGFYSTGNIYIATTGSGVTPSDINQIRDGLATQAKSQEILDKQKLPNLLIKAKLPKIK